MELSGEGAKVSKVATVTAFVETKAWEREMVNSARAMKVAKRHEYMSEKIQLFWWKRRGKKLSIIGDIEAET